MKIPTLTGKVIYRTDDGYRSARQEWNRSQQYFPRIIVYCYTNHDVSNAVCYARYYNIPLRIRSGGHNYEGYSTGNQTLIVDVSAMNTLVYNEFSHSVTVGAGATNGDVYGFLGKMDIPFPGGTCPTVGIVGYTLGGGWGLTCRAFGLGCDNVLHVTLVTAEGKILHVSQQKNADLFWAIRGGGNANFGVVTSLTFKLPPPIKKVTLCEWYMPNATLPEMRDFWQTWQQWLPETDHKLSAICSLYNDAKEGTGIFGRSLWLGNETEARQQMQPLLRTLRLQSSFTEETFQQALQKIGSYYPPYESFKSSGRFVSTLSDQQIIELLPTLFQRPPFSNFTGYSLYSLGGAVSEKSSADTAFYYRDANYMLAFQTVWTHPLAKKQNIEWFERKWPLVQRNTDGAYVNFPYGGYENYMQHYWHSNVEKLREIKTKYDCHNVFSFPQSISPY
ncbi:MAG: FAD-binding oxidoreductase [Bacilli bacterium]